MLARDQPGHCGSCGPGQFSCGMVSGKTTVPTEDRPKKGTNLGCAGEEVGALGEPAGRGADK